MPGPEDWGAAPIDEAVAGPQQWGAQPVSPIAAPKLPTQDVGRLDAFARAMAQGLTANLSDELSGLYAAGQGGWTGAVFGHPFVGLARLGYEHLTGQPGLATAAYEKARAEELEKQKISAAQYPGTTLAGNIAGAVAIPMGGLLGAATLPGRIGRSAAVGAGYGAISGAGEGEDLSDRLTRAGIGAGTGAVVGAAAVPAMGAVEGLGRIVAPAVRPLATGFRGLFTPEAEALRRVAGAIQRDVLSGGTRLTPAEFAAARTAGSPVTITELGGETTRALARSAANTSPEGRAALQQLANDRFEGQADRAADFIRNLVGGQVDTTATREGLRTTARGVNRPAYNAAYAAGDRPIWSPELERLTGSPAVESALAGAIERGKNRAINDGMGPFRPGATVTPDGRVIFNQGPTGVPTYPNLQFWDYAQRELRDAATAAQRSGRNEEANALFGLHGKLNAELDRLIPEFHAARAGAARFFGAEDALTAGENFVGRNMDINDARRAWAQMTQQERDLFRQGYAGRLVNDIMNMSDRTNVISRIAQNQAARERMELALGPQGARQVEGFLTVESAMDRLRTALGNSTTARQLVELGFAGGVGGYEWLTSDPNAAMHAGATWALLRGHRMLDARIANRVADMLVSNDPTVLARGIQRIATNQRMLQGFRDLDARLAQAGAQQAPRYPAIQGMIPSRADENQQQ